MINENYLYKVAISQKQTKQPNNSFRKLQQAYIAMKNFKKPITTNFAKNKLGLTAADIIKQKMRNNKLKMSITSMSDADLDRKIDNIVTSLTNSKTLLEDKTLPKDVISYQKQLYSQGQGSLDLYRKEKLRREILTNMI